VVEEVRERGRDRVVVLARHDDDGVRPDDERGEPLERLGRLALRVLLVHLVEEREPVLERVDEGHVVAARAALVHDEARGADTLAGGADRTVDDENPERHDAPPARPTTRFAKDATDRVHR
jgi:hypothetical protein